MLPLIYHLYIATWVIICYLPPIRGTRNNHCLGIPLYKLMPDAGFHAHLFFNVKPPDATFSRSFMRTSRLGKLRKEVSWVRGTRWKEEEFWEVSRFCGLNWWFHSPLWIPSQSLTWNLKMMGFQVRNLLFQGAIFRFHAKFWEGRVSL